MASFTGFYPSSCSCKRALRTQSASRRAHVPKVASATHPVSATHAASSPDSITTISEYKRDPELQAALDALFADTIHRGNRRVPHAEVQHHIERICQLSARLGLDRVHPDWNDGAFTGLLTTQLNGISTDNRCSLARLTFGRVAPGDLAVQTDVAAEAGAAELADQFKGPMAGVVVSEGTTAAVAADTGYCVVTYFRILSNGVLGRMRVKGLYDLEPADPARLWVTFVGFSLEPASADARSLELWREALGAHNPNMDERGVIEVRFDNRNRYGLRYIIMDPDLQLALGTSGALTTMQRVPPSSANSIS